MKNILTLLILLVCSVISKAQVIYTEKDEYEKAINLYYKYLDSYTNYQKKLKFYREYKYPKSETYPPNGDAWLEIFKPQLNKLGIKNDNQEERLHPEVRPYGLIHINFIEDPNSDFLLIKITDTPISPYDYKFSAVMYSFTHPGQKPIFYEPKKDVVDTLKVKTEPTPKKIVDNLIKPKKEIKIIVPEIYIMPNGVKYTYDQLVVVYPSMKYDSVFKKNLVH